MRTIAGLCLLFFFFGASCTDKNNVPSGIIPQKKMEKIMWDMVEADQYAAIYFVKD